MSHEPMDDDDSMFSTIVSKLKALGYELADYGIYELELENQEGQFQIYIAGYTEEDKVDLGALKCPPMQRGVIIDKLTTSDTLAAMLFVDSWHFKNVQGINYR